MLIGLKLYKNGEILKMNVFIECFSLTKCEVRGLQINLDLECMDIMCPTTCPLSSLNILCTH